MRGKRLEVAQAMSWDRRGYYYRARKVRGRVVRAYVGKGRVAEIAAEMDAINRDDPYSEFLAPQQERSELIAVEDETKDLNDKVELVAVDALLAAGCHQHKRGEWRRRREHNQSAEA